MKKKVFLSLLAFIISMPMFADVVINATNFPDANFRNYLLTNTSTNNSSGMGINGYGKDGKLTTKELNSIQWMSLRNQGISDLKGIEYFTELAYLDCGRGNNVGSANFSQNTKLQFLDISGGTLQSLDVSKLTALIIFDCSNNSLTSLDVSNNTNLTQLWCYNNPISSLDISHNTKLISLFVSNVQSLNINHITTTLKDLYVGNMPMTNLDLSAHNALERLEIALNDNLSSITLPINTTKLKDLYICYNPHITTLNLATCTALERLQCPGNGLTSIDVSNNTSLQMLDCSNNHLTSLDVSRNTALRALYCQDNQLTSLDVSRNINLTGLQCHNNHLTELNLAQNTKLTSDLIYVYGLSLKLGEIVVLTGDNVTVRGVYQNNVSYNYLSLSPQTLSKDYVDIDGRSKLGVQCNTNNGVLTSYGNYTAMTSAGNNYIVVADEANGKTDVHKPNSSINYNYNTGYTGTYNEAKTMEVNIGTSAHGMYIHPETLRGSDNFYSGTLYLEFPAKIPEGVQCYYAKGLDANEDLVGLTEVTGTIPANTAVIVKAPSEYKFFAFNESDETPTAPADNIIEGTIEGLSVTPGSVLTLGHNVDRSTGEYDNFGFWNYRGNKISPFRAYIPKANLSAGAKNGFSLVFPENGTTGIARMANSSAAEEGAWYTLGGTRINGKPTTKGIYVNKGQKVVIR